METGHAADTVRRVAGGKKQRDGRNELDEPDEAELERASGQRVRVAASIAL